MKKIIALFLPKRKKNDPWYTPKEMILLIIALKEIQAEKDSRQTNI